MGPAKIGDDDYCSSYSTVSGVQWDARQNAVYILRLGGWSGSGQDADAGHGWSLFHIGFFCEPPYVSPEAPTNPTHQTKKHRYLSVNPNVNAPLEVALKVEVTQMWRCAGDELQSCLTDDDCRTVCADDTTTFCVTSANCATGSCVNTGPCANMAPTDPPLTWWVQQPQQIAEGCIPSCGDEDWIARLEKEDGDPSTAPYSQDWSDYDLLHIGDCPIVPCTTYSISACDAENTNICSLDPLVIGTISMPIGTPRFYGDVTGGTNPDLSMAPPDGFVSVSDIFGWILNKQNYGTSNLPQTHPTWMDLHGLGAGIPPNYILGVSDLTQITVFGFGRFLPWENSSGGLEPGDCP